MVRRAVRYMFLFFVMCVFCSCGQGGNSSGSQETQKSSAEGSSDAAADAAGQDALVVYAIRDSVGYYFTWLSEFNASHSDVELDLHQFDDPEEMETQLVAAISGGKCPDVILLDEQTGLDLAKMAQSGQFLDLVPYLEEYTEDNYYTSILEAARTDGHQYLLPVGYSLTYLLASESSGALRGDLDGQEFYADLQERMDALAADQGRGVIFPMYQTSFADWLGCQGVDVAAGDFDEEAVRQSAEVYRSFLSSVEISQGYAPDFLTAAEQVDILAGQGYLPGYARYYDSLYRLGLGEQLVLGAMPARDGGLCAAVTRIGMVGASSEQKETAVSLLLGLLDADLLDSCGLEIPMSPSREVLSHQIELLEKTKGKNVRIGSESYQIEAMTAGMGDRVLELLDQVRTAWIPNAAAAEIVNTCMQPYFDGESELEECLEQLEGRLELYADE